MFGHEAVGVDNDTAVEPKPVQRLDHRLRQPSIGEWAGATTCAHRDEVGRIHTRVIEVRKATPCSDVEILVLLLVLIHVPLYCLRTSAPGMRVFLIPGLRGADVPFQFSVAQTSLSAIDRSRSLRSGHHNVPRIERMSGILSVNGASRSSRRCDALRRVTDRDVRATKGMRRDIHATENGNGDIRGTSESTSTDGSVHGGHSITHTAEPGTSLAVLYIATGLCVVKVRKGR